MTLDEPTVPAVLGTPEFGDVVSLLMAVLVSTLRPYHIVSRWPALGCLQPLAFSPRPP